MVIERLTRADRDEIVRVLIDSFAEYPVMRFMVGSGPNYLERLAVLVGFFADARFARSFPVLGVRDQGRLAGVALVSEPNPEESPPEVRALFAQLAADLGADVLERMERYDASGGHELPVQPFHYLGMVGVPPEHQGKGYGGALVEAVKDLARDHENSSGVCLHTEMQENVPLYEHLGFETVFEADIEGIHTHRMFWKNA